MARVAQEMGVEIRLGEAVEQLEFDNGGHRVTGVHTRSGMHPFDAVVLNADFARAMTRLFPDHLRKRWNNERIKKSKFSCSTFMMYLGIEGRYPLPHHSIYIAEDYRGNLRDIEQDHQLSEDTSFYVQNACVTDPGLAPEGHSTLYVLAPVTQQHPNVDWRRETALMRGRLLKQISKAGYEGIENRIVYERIVTPQDWDTGYEIHLGATFNLAHSLDQMLHLRPHNRFEDLDGVYLVGGGTHPGSGLPVIYESARISSKLLLEDLGMTVRGADRCRAANGVRDGSAFSVTP
jgi:phytoene desaturase